MTMTSNAATETLTVVTFRGVRLVRSTESGPRGGTRSLYQAESADRVWGTWYPTASQAARLSNASDRVGTGTGV